MAHTFGKASTRASSTSNPITASFTTEVGETVLVLCMTVGGATDRTGGAPTFAGRTMTQASTTQKAAASPEASAELWYLVNPPIGTYNVSIPNAGSLTVFYTLATGRAAPGGKSELGVVNGANGTSANPSPGAVTTTKNGAIGFAVVATGAQTWSPSAQAGTGFGGTGTSLGNFDDGAFGGGMQYHLQAALGATTLNWTFATSEDFGAVVAYFNEVEPVSAPNLLPGVKSVSSGWHSERIR